MIIRLFFLGYKTPSKHRNIFVEFTLGIFKPRNIAAVFFLHFFYQSALKCYTRGFRRICFTYVYDKIDKNCTRAACSDHKEQSTYIVMCSGRVFMVMELSGNRGGKNRVS